MLDVFTRVAIVPLELNRDYAEIDRLLAAEQWPFLRSDLEASHAQPRATALVARQGDDVLGFFAAHHFGDIGYLDMMIVDSRARRSHVARKLYFETMRRMRQNGLHCYVAHATNDSCRMFRYLRFKAGQTFTLLSRDPQGEPPAAGRANLRRLTADDVAGLIYLDEQVFGMRRESWISALLAQPSTKFFGTESGGQLTVSVCLRARKENALCLDALNALDFTAAQPLLDEVIASFSEHRLECFARTDSPLHHFLVGRGFNVPEFFVPIGPLVEWRKGDVSNVGLSQAVQSLSWF